MHKIISFIIFVLVCFSLSAQKDLRKNMKRLGADNSIVYFVDEVKLKPTSKDIKEVVVDFTYYFRKDSVQPHVVMNYTVTQKQPIAKFKSVSYQKDGKAFFATDSVARFFCNSYGNSWQNRHSIVTSIDDFLKLFNDLKRNYVVMQFDNTETELHYPKKYWRIAKLIVTTITIETGIKIPQQ